MAFLSTVLMNLFMSKRLNEVKENFNQFFIEINSLIFSKILGLDSLGKLLKIKQMFDF